MVEKTDAMLMHEKWIAEVIKKNPKRTNNEVMHIEVRKLVAIAAGILVILFIIATMM